MALPSFCVFNRKCSLFRSLILPSLINQNLKLNALPRPICIRQYSATVDEDEPKKKSKVRVVQVNVIMPDQKVSSMTLEQAQKMAKRRDFSMTKLFDPPKFASFGGRDVYEMATKSQQIKQAVEASDVPKDSEFKDKKTVTFSASIAEHDLNIKLKQIKKWLSKKHVVLAIVVDGGGTGQSMQEKIAYIQEECKDICKISSSAKKKQTNLTFVPELKAPETSPEPTTSPNAS